MTFLPLRFLSAFVHLFFLPSCLFPFLSPLFFVSVGLFVSLLSLSHTQTDRIVWHINSQTNRNRQGVGKVRSFGEKRVWSRFGWVYYPLATASRAWEHQQKNEVHRLHSEVAFTLGRHPLEQQSGPITVRSTWSSRTNDHYKLEHILHTTPHHWQVQQPSWHRCLSLSPCYKFFLILWMNDRMK